MVDNWDELSVEEKIAYMQAPTVVEVELPAPLVALVDGKGKALPEPPFGRRLHVQGLANIPDGYADELSVPQREWIKVQHPSDLEGLELLEQEHAARVAAWDKEQAEAAARAAAKAAEEKAEGGRRKAEASSE